MARAPTTEPDDRTPPVARHRAHAGGGACREHRGRAVADVDEAGLPVAAALGEHREPHLASGGGPGAQCGGGGAGREVADGAGDRVDEMDAGALTAVSSRISCTASCPLPPYEHTTAQDLVHAGTSIAAIGLTVLAMLAVAATAADRVQKRVARIGAVVCTPILVALAITLLAIGRSTVTAVLERLGLVGVLGWVTACALLTLRPTGRMPADHQRAPRRS